MKTKPKHSGLECRKRLTTQRTFLRWHPETANCSLYLSKIPSDLDTNKFIATAAKGAQAMASAKVVFLFGVLLLGTLLAPASLGSRVMGERPAHEEAELATSNDAAGKG